MRPTGISCLTFATVLIAVCAVLTAFGSPLLDAKRDKSPDASKSVTAGNGTVVIAIEQRTITITKLEDANATDANSTDLLIEIEGVSTILIVNNATNKVINGTSQGFDELSIVRVPFDGGDDDDDDDSSLEENFLFNGTKAANVTNFKWRSMFPTCDMEGCSGGLVCDSATNTCRTAISDV